MRKIVFTRNALWSNVILLLRIWCGIIFIRYGMSFLHQSSVHDFVNTLQTADIPFPLISAYLCKSTEFFGGIFLVIGFLVKPACLFLVIDMIVATFVFHHAHLLNNGLTTFLLLLCLLNIMLGKTDILSIDYYLSDNKKLM